MRFWRRFVGSFCLLLLLVVAQAGAKASAQTAKDATPSWARYCIAGGGFCIEHPAKWTNLGEIYDGAGVVFAEPNKQRAQAEWNNITAAAIDLPDSDDSTDHPSMNDLINQVMTPSGGAVIHTVERMETVIRGYPSQVVTAEVQEPGKPPATERVAFIDADDVLYTIALRCAPVDFRRLQPVFLRALKSWRELPPSQPPAAPGADGEAPK